MHISYITYIQQNKTKTKQKGAFVGAGFVWLSFLDIINYYRSQIGVDPAVTVKTIGGCFYTYPNSYAPMGGISVAQAVWSEIFGTALLLAGIYTYIHTYITY